VDLQIAWPFASAFLAFILAAGEMFAPARGPTRRLQYLRACILLALSVLIVHGTLLISGRIYQVPWFFGWQSPGGYLMAPLLYACVRLSLEPAGAVLGRRRSWLFAAGPAALVAAYALWQALCFPEERGQRIAAFYAGGGVEYWIILSGFAYFLAYLAATGLFIFRRLTPALRPAYSGLVLLACGATICSLGLAAMLTGLTVLLEITLYGMAAFVPVAYLLARRNPDLLAEWLERLHRRPPGGATESRLGALNIPALSSRLDELMRRDRYYANEELTIADLARALNITSHQVSELLNRRLATSFFHYVNGFRVQEACRLLRGEGDRTILSIAYEVGFNSKSAFHRAFSRHTGLSPREFRRASRADAAGDESV
jgi:AraC-like DNA-binding protein